MASKNCPHCQKQVPVACKRCTCGHVFFASRRGAASNSREISSSSTSDLPPTDSLDPLDPGGDPSLLQPTRRSGRVVRERPQFYDALEYENQTRREERGPPPPRRDSDSEPSSTTDLSVVSTGSLHGRTENIDDTFGRVFVTVGSTGFSDLINLVVTDEVLVSVFKKWETRRVLIQRGSGSFVDQHLEENTVFYNRGITFEWYHYKDFLTEDILWADIVIAHAGAGTSIEVLELGKPLIVMPNRKLMDDHQLELARKLDQGHHALLTSLDTFVEDVEEVKRSWFVPLPPRNVDGFANFMKNRVLGIYD